MSATRLSVELSPEEQARLSERSRQLNVRPEELAMAALRDLLGMPGEDFQRAAERVLRKNRALYERLR